MLWQRPTYGVVGESGVFNVINLRRQSEKVLLKLVDGGVEVRTPSGHCCAVVTGAHWNVSESVADGFLSIPHVDVVNFEEQQRRSWTGLAVAVPRF